MKIAICDDDRLELRRINDIVRDFSASTDAKIKVETFMSGSALLLYIQKFGGFDLLILDIVMDGLNGIELASKIREQDNSCKIIFISSSPEFAVDSYKVNAYYYLLKGDNRDELQRLLQKAADEEYADSAAGILVKEKGRWTRVPLHTIHYVESINHTVCLHLYNKKTITSFNALAVLEAGLLADKRFVKCHKSYVVNMSSVSSITGKDFVLADGTSVPISRNLYQQVKVIYLDYFFKK